MPKICEVPQCKEIGAHQFPAGVEIRKKWLKAIRRPNFKPENNSRLCRLHFLETDYQNISNYTGTVHLHRYLKKTAVPSVFPWTTKSLSEAAKCREERLLARNSRKSLFQQTDTVQPFKFEVLRHSENSGNLTQEYDISIPNIANEVYIETEVTEESIRETPIQQATVGVQTSAILKIFSTELLLTDDEAVMFYTGLESYSKFQLVLSTLLPMANNLNYRWSKVIGLSVEEQFLILLIKLRRNKPDFELAKMFNVSKTVVSNIIVTWVNFIYDVWSMIDIWPQRDLVDYHMPQIFKNESSKTRVIIDATEVPIAKPSNPISQKATYSAYKNTNTLKFLIGSTPGGLLVYCSDGYGGATSDRQMIERSSLIKICDEGDSIMADRGFNVQDLFASKNITINIPTFLKGRSQLPGVVLKRDQRLTSQRVHIERLIGLTKTYKILQTPIISFYVPIASKIFFICMMLCNFREKIVNKNKKA
ncbi:uncharacterized protein LOC112051988 [Bicyclus anynana]|uniref:Uncharacterized protein LOC112051988 n=1 Tax=Bicyclus anynana TaxID=110368 RepID=A0A6J1NFS4_BICAN|nr:uncharacterized protein LOC112051988 [Bicyclus anynana]